MVSDAATPEHRRRQAREPASKPGLSCMNVTIAVAVLGIPVPGPQGLLRAVTGRGDEPR